LIHTLFIDKSVKKRGNKMSILSKLGITEWPWVVGEKENYYSFDGTIEEKKLLEINNIPLRFPALGIGTNTGGVAIIPLDESNNANAKLIAAAPDMLEALILEVRNHEKNGIGEGYQWNELAKDLIQKATNKSWEEIKDLL